MKGYKTPRGNYRYKARDGKYYNGYMGSPDLSEDMRPLWDKAIEDMGKAMAKDCGMTYEEFLKEAKVIKSKK